MEKLSVVIITFNEEKNIKACIDSVKELSDDIVVLDSFSSDKTEYICKAYSNVRFIQKEWQGYSKTKNHANQLVKNNYLLSLDADEVLSSRLINSIKEIQSWEGVYEFNRLTNYCGKWINYCGWYPDKKIRIFHKNRAHWEGDFIHEVLNVSQDNRINFLSGDLYHYSYHSVSDHYNQIEKYSTLHAQRMLAENKKVTPIKLYISPVFKFFRTYVLQQGFLDGKAGYLIAKISAKAVWLKYRKLKKLSATK